MNENPPTAPAPRHGAHGPRPAVEELRVPFWIVLAGVGVGAWIRGRGAFGAARGHWGTCR